jgi:oxygen-dependent protoporphyrinogen oxidase
MIRVVIIGGGFSGLSTGYNIQEMAAEEGLDVKITIVESSERLGGKAWTEEHEGYRLEGGVNGFLDNEPSTLELAESLGISGEIQKASDAAKNRYILAGGKLHPLPEGPMSFLKSGLLSVKGKIRLAQEPFTKPAPAGKDETVGEFGRRHLGQEAVDKLIGAMIAGVYAGDVERLSVKSCFPLLLNVEKKGDGSLIKGMMRMVKEKKAAGEEAKASAGPGGKLTSFKKGMGYFIDSLEKGINGDILKGKRVIKIAGEKGGYMVYLEGDWEPIDADVVITAAPSYDVAEMVDGLDPGIASELRGIPYVALTVVALGFDRAELDHPLDGFGFLISLLEERKILGSLWTTSIFPGRSPEGKFLIRSMIGGALQKELALMDEKAIVAIIRDELRDILGIDAEPELVKVFKHEKAIPQYPVGHAERVERIMKNLEDHPGLYMTGNSFKGIAIKDCARNSKALSREIIEYMKGL